MHIYILKYFKIINIIKQFIIKHCCFLNCLLVLALSACIAPSILAYIDYASYTNKSQSLLQIRTEYFIDTEKYSYLIKLHANTALCIAVIVILATGTMIITYFIQVCGMFKIAR